MATLTNSFEGGSAGTTITTGNSGGASGDAWTLTTSIAGGTCTYSTTGAAHGSLCMAASIGATGGTERRGWSVNPGDSSAVQYFRFYLNPANNSGGTVSPLRGMSADSSGQRFRVGVGLSGTVILINNSNSTVWSSAPLTSGTQWRIEVSIVGSTSGTGRVRIYAGDATTAAQDSGDVSANFGGPVRSVWFGQTNAAAAVSLRIDDCGWSDTGLLGPAVASHAGAADLTADSTLTAAGNMTAPAVADLTASSTVGVTSTAVGNSAAPMVAEASLTASATPERVSAAALTADGTMTAGAVTVAPAAVVLSASTTVSAGASATIPGAAVLAATSSLVADATAVRPASVSLLATSAVSAHGATASDALVALAAHATLTVSATAVSPLAVALTSATGLTADAAASPAGVAGRGRVRLPRAPSVRESARNRVRVLRDLSRVVIR